MKVRLPTQSLQNNFQTEWGHWQLVLPEESWPWVGHRSLEDSRKVKLNNGKKANDKKKESNWEKLDGKGVKKGKKLKKKSHIISQRKNWRGLNQTENPLTLARIRWRHWAAQSIKTSSQLFIRCSLVPVAGGAAPPGQGLLEGSKDPSSALCLSPAHLLPPNWLRSSSLLEWEGGQSPRWQKAHWNGAATGRPVVCFHHPLLRSVVAVCPRT